MLYLPCFFRVISPSFSYLAGPQKIRRHPATATERSSSSLHGHREMGPGFGNQSSPDAPSMEDLPTFTPKRTQM